MNEAVAYIEKHYAEEELSLNSLAAHVNFSPNHLSAVFKQETGQPFIKYLTDYRMEHAKELLCSTSKRSNEIGQMVGYKDPHYFSYLFKKTQGVTPTQYRNGTREEEQRCSMVIGKNSDQSWLLRSDYHTLYFFCLI
jgi:two-component system response regulator YesN